jgi:hypothetical protein
MTLPTGIAKVNTCSKWGYSSKKIVLRIFSISYFQKWAGEIAPIWGKNTGLLALLRIAKISYYSIPALAPFMVV